MSRSHVVTCVRHMDEIVRKQCVRARVMHSGVALNHVRSVESCSGAPLTHVLYSGVPLSMCGALLAV